MLAQSRAVDGGGGNEGIVTVVWGGCPESVRQGEPRARESFLKLTDRKRNDHQSWVLFT